MKPHQYLMVLLAVVLNSCVQQAPTELSFYGTWRLQSVKKLTAQPATTDQLLQEANENSLAQEGMALSVFADHRFTLIKGNGDYFLGKWTVKKENQQLLLQSKARAFIANIEGSGKDRRLLVRDLPTTGEFKFVFYAEPLANQAEDQFSPENNTWRIKPSAPEDTAAIKKRLANYVQHLAYLLKSATQRNQTVVSFEFSLGPVRIYSGGLGVIPFSKVPDSWKQVFYTYQQAALAHQLYTVAIQQTHYNGASTGKWVEDDYHLLLALYKQLVQ